MVIKWMGRTAALLCLWAVLPSQAALVDVDAGFGAGSGTLDPATGLVFLDVDRTAGHSYADLRGVPADYFFPGSPATPGMFGPGQAFAGFRYATTAEVLGLFADSGVPNPGPLTPSDETRFFTLVGMLGIPAVDVFGMGEVLAYRAITSTPDPGSTPQSRQIAELVIDRLPDPSRIFVFASGFLGDEQVPSPGISPPDGRGFRAAGSWLVQAQASAVPAPSTSALLALGLLVLAGRRRGVLRRNRRQTPD